MNRLTHQRVNGIKQGYWTAAKKDELVERLAAYEDTGLTPEEIMDGKMLTGWIPCSERLPEMFCTVLITAKLSEDKESLVYEGARTGKRWGAGWRGKS